MYTVKSINTAILAVERVECMEDITKLLEGNISYKVVAFTIPAIVFGEYHNGFTLGLEGLKFDQIDSIRVFNTQNELYLYRFADHATGKASTSLKGRLRKDSPDTESGSSFYHDASQILIGSWIIEKTETHTLIAEDRGFQLLLPNNWIVNELDQYRLRVITRNYLAEWDNGQLNYCDHRFVAIDNQDKEL